MRARAILEPLLSVGGSAIHGSVIPTKPLFSGRWSLLGTSADRNGVSKGGEKVSTGSDLCRPWREETGHEIDQAARVTSVRVFVGDEVGDREANETTRPYQRSKQRLRVLPTEPVG
jgi:hypothetical protein